MATDRKVYENRVLSHASNIQTTECGICFERYNYFVSDRHAKTIYPCGHTFCEKCLTRVLQCPTCRGEIVTSTFNTKLVVPLDEESSEESYAKQCFFFTQNDDDLNNELNVRRPSDINRFGGTVLSNGKYIPCGLENYGFMNKTKDNEVPLSMVVLSDDTFAIGFSTNKIVITVMSEKESIPVPNTIPYIVVGDVNAEKELIGHTSYVCSLAVLENGDLASGSADKTIRIWNVDDCSTIKVLEGHQDWVTCLLVIAKGQLLASGSRDKTIKIWNIKSGHMVKELLGHTDWINCMTILCDNTLAAGSRDSTISIWSTKKGLRLKTLNNMNSNVLALALLPNGNLASGSKDKVIRIWNTNNGSLLKELTGHLREVTCLVVINNGDLVSGSADWNIRIWDIQKGRTEKLLRGHWDWIRFLVALPDGNLMGGSQNIIRMWKDLDKRYKI